MDTLNIGIATTDITPPVGLLLCGYYPRASTSVDHSLRAEALVCDDGTDAWALVTADVLAFSLPLVEKLREEIATRTGLSPDGIHFSATHTHSGPRVFAIEWGERPEEAAYFQALRDALIELVTTAWERRAPGEFVHARTQAQELASNRRAQREDGVWYNRWDDPEGRSSGYFDASVELLGVRREDGRLDALLVTYGCHPVCFGGNSMAISGDYVSYVKDALEASGQVGVALFAVSGHGNIDPRVCVQDAPAVPRDMGRRLAAIVLEALPKLTPVPGAGIATAIEPWPITLAWELDANNSAFHRLSTPGAVLHTQAVAMRAGGLLFLGFPGEVVSEYMAAFRRISSCPITLLLSCVNDFVGYFPTDTILEQGAHEMNMCPARPVEAAVLEKATRLLGRVISEQ